MTDTSSLYKLLLVNSVEKELSKSTHFHFHHYALTNFIVLSVVLAPAQ